MKNKFTFKKEPLQKGLSGVGNPYPDVVIKHNGLEIGSIVAPAWHNNGTWGIRFAVVTDNGFEWKRILKEFESEADARKWLQESITILFKKFNFYYFPKDGE